MQALALFVDINWPKVLRVFVDGAENNKWVLIDVGFSRKRSRRLLSGFSGNTHNWLRCAHRGSEDFIRDRLQRLIGLFYDWSSNTSKTNVKHKGIKWKEKKNELRAYKQRNFNYVCFHIKWKTMLFLLHKLQNHLSHSYIYIYTTTRRVTS